MIPEISQKIIKAPLKFISVPPIFPKRYLFPIHSGHFFGKIGGTLMNLSGALIIFWLISGIIIYKRKS
jgi:hypothetical protein